MPTTTQPSMTRLNVNEAWYEAVFASALQPSDSPTPTWPPAGCAGCASSPMRREADDERDL
ncbi:MAG: hypothetical protein QOG01_2747 [Pseudonocardiales bacterium]|jgi:hypothetical protein|nr:hypothetical protein [Pseudonocardiales bacterium]